MASGINISQDLDMFRPPLARGMKVLDRSVFQKTVQLKAAQVFDNKNISKIRQQLERSKDALQQERLANVWSDPDAELAKTGRKCILLRPEVREQPLTPITNGKVDEKSAVEHEPTNGSAQPIPWPHSSAVTELIQQNLISITPYNLQLKYCHWTYHDIISSILPEELHNEIPSGFSQVGHIVHLNLREQYHPWKYLIGEILIDKNPGAKAVINKIDDVGEESEFRTFKYEVLAGEDDLNVVVSEAGCEFAFDYSKVYWNPRLSTEHRRMVDFFKEGEAVCDVMAGIGPFAVPAGKKNVFVWANDLNPESHAGLVEAVRRNKVADFVKPSCEDGRTFIRDAAERLLEEDRTVELKRRVSRRDTESKGTGYEVYKTLTQPRTFQHYVLNLPASALTFLPSFIGLYPPHLRAKLPAGTLMPLIHVYCFSTKDELEEGATSEQEGTAGAVGKICVEISKQLDFPMQPGKIDEDGSGTVQVWDVRDVAPKKRMFCATFRLPDEVAFRDRG